jgi:cytochrome c oxidase assembly protein subunit 15
VVAGGISLLFVGLGVLVLRREEARRAVGVLWVVAAVVLGIQILLGALTVWQLLASWTVTSHLITGNAFAVALLFIHRGLADAHRPPAARPRPSARVTWAIVVVAGLLFAQMVLGGLVSSTFVGLACPDWPQCMDGVWFPSWTGPQGLHLIHRTNGYALTAAVALAAWWGRGETAVARWLQIALVLVCAQVAVGVANVLLMIPVEITGLHSALAAGLVGTLALTLREAFRNSPA